jgi:predicted nucleotidyltransferase
MDMPRKICVSTGIGIFRKRFIAGQIHTCMETSIKEIEQKILPILKEHNIKKAGLFGSCVRGEMREDSDIDILVEIEDNISLLDFVGINLEIEEALKRKVDLVEYSTIKPLLKEKIIREQVGIL